MDFAGLFPPEILSAILARVPFEDRSYAREVCIPWAATLDRSSLWANVPRYMRVNALGAACRRGSLESAQWLASAFGLNPDDGPRPRFFRRAREN